MMDLYVHQDIKDHEMRSVKTLILALALSCLSGTIWAADIPTSQLANTCGACHGLYQDSYAEIPSLRGYTAEVLLARLHAFRDGTAPSTVMKRVVNAFSDKQLQAIAKHIAEL
jgi:sulfide dehydrogenase cytochrome subunit